MGKFLVFFGGLFPFGLVGGLILGYLSKRSKPRGLWIRHDSMDDITIKSSATGRRVYRALSVVERWLRKGITVPIGDNELLFLAPTNRVTLISSNHYTLMEIEWRASAKDPDIILAGPFAGHTRLMANERRKILLAPRETLVIRTDRAYEPDTGIPLRSVV